MAELVILERTTSFSVPSLQQISLVYMSANMLCNNNELIGLILKCDIRKNMRLQLAIRNKKTYKHVEAKANELLAKLPVTGKFKEMILEWLWPVTYRIIYWKYFYAATINKIFLQYFYWTAQGRIDSKRTGKSIVRNRRIPVAKRFMLACSLCLSDEIPEIWEEMSITSKLDLSLEKTYTSRLGYFWTSKLCGEYDFYSRMFLITILRAVKIESLDTVKYIFSLLSEQKTAFAELCSIELVKKFGYQIYYSDKRDITFFILSQMTENSLKKLLKSQPLIVMAILLTTEQSEFLEVLKDKLGAISKTSIEKLLYYIFCMFYTDTFRDHNYVKLIVSVWQLLEDTCKMWLRGRNILNYCVCVMISNDFRILLTKRPSKKANGKRSLDKIILLNKDKWEILLFFIENAIVSTASLENNRSRLFKLLRVRKSNRFAWRRLLKFVRDNKTKEN